MASTLNSKAGMVCCVRGCGSTIGTMEILWDIGSTVGSVGTMRVLWDCGSTVGSVGVLWVLWSYCGDCGNTVGQL